MILAGFFLSVILIVSKFYFSLSLHWPPARFKAKTSHLFPHCLDSHLRPSPMSLNMLSLNCFHVMDVCISFYDLQLVLSVLSCKSTKDLSVLLRGLFLCIPVLLIPERSLLDGRFQGLILTIHFVQWFSGLPPIFQPLCQL